MFNQGHFNHSAMKISEIDLFQQHQKKKKIALLSKKVRNPGVIQSTNSSIFLVISYILPKATNQPSSEYRPVISSPSGFEHQVHVGFDPETGEFSGLPETWARILQNSDISVTERKKNPRGLLDVLNFIHERNHDPNEPKVKICRILYVD